MEWKFEDPKKSSSYLCVVRCGKEVFYNSCKFYKMWHGKRNVWCVETWCSRDGELEEAITDYSNASVNYPLTGKPGFRPVYVLCWLKLSAPEGIELTSTSV